MEITQLADYPYEAQKVASWYYNEWACHAPNVSEAMVLENVTEHASNRNDIPLSIIVRENNQLVGVAELKYRENKNYPEYVHWIGGVFVELNNRGRGISNLLVSEVQSKAVSLGIDKLYLQCENHNVSLYKTYGFHELHQASDDELSAMIMLWEAHT